MQEFRGDYLVNVDIPSDKSAYRVIRGASSSVVMLERALPKGVRELYRDAAELVREEASMLGRSRLRDDHLVERATFYEGVFSVAMAISHYEENPDGALAMMTQGARILKEWRDKASG